MEKKKLNRRSREDGFSRESNRELNYENPRINPNIQKPIGSKKRSRILVFINFLLFVAFFSYVFIKDIFPMPIRLGLLLAGLILQIYILRGTRKKTKFVTKILAYMILLILGVLHSSGLYTFVKIENAIAIMNKKAETEDVRLAQNLGNSFNIYISGIDTNGDVGNVSRSDVNIVATVNTVTGEVLLTSIPRDTYLPIAGGGNGEYDKLTHAGIYGVQSSMDTLANALDTEIPYFAKVNFDSLYKIIEVVGGVTIDNPYEFVGHKGTHFSKGQIHLNGETALEFVRERYNLPNGDLDRGRNQERVLSAMIKKVSSPENILKLGEILEVSKDAIISNVTANKAISILNSQIMKFGNSNVETQDIEGEGQLGLPSYAMPGYSLWMFVPDENSINQAREKIENVLN